MDYARHLVYQKDAAYHGEESGQTITLSCFVTSEDGQCIVKRDSFRKSISADGYISLAIDLHLGRAGELQSAKVKPIDDRDTDDEEPF